MIAYGMCRLSRLSDNIKYASRPSFSRAILLSDVGQLDEDLWTVEDQDTEFALYGQFPSTIHRMELADDGKHRGH